MNLSDLYNQMYTDAIQQIEADKYKIDHLIDSQQDNRSGITLIIQPDKNSKERIQNILHDFKKAEPNQYYYPDSDIHVTVMSIISCYAGFELSAINIADYKQVISSCIPKDTPIEIEFKGLTASPSCVMVQGFLLNDSLRILRENIRKAFRNSSLKQSIDARYTIQTAHATVLRFKQPLTNKEHFLQTLECFRDHYFGKANIRTLSLVHNDWYQRKEKVTELARFEI